MTCNCAFFGLFTEGFHQRSYLLTQLLYIYSVYLYQLPQHCHVFLTGREKSISRCERADFLVGMCS